MKTLLHICCSYNYQSRQEAPAHNAAEHGFIAIAPSHGYSCFQPLSA